MWPDFLHIGGVDFRRRGPFSMKEQPDAPPRDEHAVVGGLYTGLGPFRLPPGEEVLQYISYCQCGQNLYVSAGYTGDPTEDLRTRLVALAEWELDHHDHPWTPLPWPELKKEEHPCQS